MDPKQRLKFNAEIKEYFTMRPGIGRPKSSGALVVNNIPKDKGEPANVVPKGITDLRVDKTNQQTGAFTKAPKRTPQKQKPSKAVENSTTEQTAKGIRNEKVWKLTITKEQHKEPTKPSKTGNNALKPVPTAAIAAQASAECQHDLTSPLVALERMAALKRSAADIDKQLEQLKEQNLAILMAPQPAPPRRLPRRQLKKTFYQLIPNRVFVGNLIRNITQADLYETFSTFGTIQKINIFVFDSGSSMGYGFITFDSEFGAKRALNAGCVLVRGIPLNVDQALVKRHIFDGEEAHLIDAWQLEDMPHKTATGIAPVGREKIAREFHKRVMMYGAAP